MAGRGGAAPLVTSVERLAGTGRWVGDGREAARAAPEMLIKEPINHSSIQLSTLSPPPRCLPFLY